MHIMENKDIAKLFKLCGHLMELHKENSFRIKAMTNASFRIEKLPFLATQASLEELSEQPHIGPSTANKIKQIVTTGTFPELEKYLAETPEGIVEMLRIKGLGPKKILIIWQDLEIESVGELYYACNENRLIQAKGFGLKTQNDIIKAIEFTIASQGWFLYAKVKPSADLILAHLINTFPDAQVSFTGDFRRKLEVIEKVEIILDAEKQLVLKAIKSLSFEFDVNNDSEKISFKDNNGFPFSVISSSKINFAKDLLITTGSLAHVKSLLELGAITTKQSELHIYESLGLSYIEPELREGNNEINLAKSNQLPTLIEYSDLLGTLHNHSTYSDGVHTLKEMATYCKEDLALQYLGICDHSKSAVYANGLKVENLEAQWREIDILNTELAPFKIFKGIESDILSDGSLDYNDEILSQFDFVVASVHSNLKMDESKATQRIIKAVENRYTTILGHPTGRLLLSRKGYPIDYKKVIDACAANQVVIEINANPLRLDLDWRWHQYALEKGVILSINPDAHRKDGFLDMQYGVYVARKGGLTKEKCLNAMDLAQIEGYFETRKKRIYNT